MRHSFHDRSGASGTRVAKQSFATRQGLALRIAFAFAATVALSILLLVPDPFALLGFPRDSGRESVNSIIPDSVQHGVSYAILTACLCIAFAARDLRGVTRTALLALAHGATTELLQIFIPNRVCDVRDFLANLTGIAVSSLLILAAFHGRARRLAPWPEASLHKVVS